MKEKVLCILLRSSFPMTFWWSAVDCAIYMINRISTITALGYISPFKCVFGTAPNLKWLRIWGCKCYALKPVAEIQKIWDDKAYSGYFVERVQQNTGYIMNFCPALNKIMLLCTSFSMP